MWTVGGFFVVLSQIGGLVEGLLTGLITLLVIAIVIAVICYIVARLASQFVPGLAPYVWLVWAIGGLIVLVFALRLFGPALGVKL
jgi:hypothetical protein